MISFSSNTTYSCQGFSVSNVAPSFFNFVSNIKETKFAKVIIPFEIRQKISNALRIEHEKKNNCSKEIKSNIQKQVSVLENRIEKLFQDKLDGIITYEQWKTFNDKWQVEKDKLSFQLEEINKLDKEFYAKADIILGFTDNAHQYYLQGNLYQKRKILEIISEKITYKDKNFDIELKPIFRQIAENQYILQSEYANTRTLNNIDFTGIELNENAKPIKNSPNYLLLDTFVELLYQTIIDVNTCQIVNMIELLGDCA